MSIPRQLPNALTVIRILLAPLVLALALDPALRWWSAGLFLLGMATDGVDGFLARRYQLISKAGILLDPIADKALTAAGFIALWAIGELPWWVLALVFSREIGITVFRLATAKKKVLAANTAGKIKTVSQVVAITFALTPWSPEQVMLSTILMALAVTVTVITGIAYVLSWLRAAEVQ